LLLIGWADGWLIEVDYCLSVSSVRETKQS
jgi:hypothetical protein